jgi:tetratricopeptide (TPR) repeat protein
MRQMGTALALVAGLSVAEAQPAGPDSMAVVQHAFQLQQSGDYAGAADAYRAFLKVRPNEPGALSNLGVVLVKLGRFEEAIVEYEAAEKLLPGDSRIELNLALVYQKSGRLEEATKKLEALHTALPQETQVTLLLADCYLQTASDDKVIELLRPTEATNPEDLAVAYMLGTALIRKQNIAEGQVRLDRILKHGDSAEARFLLGTRMFESGDYPAAAKQLARAIELDPKLPQLQAFYGRALLYSGDPDGASTAFRNELSLNPNDFAANLGLAQILTVRKRFPEAKPLLDRALLVQPQSTEASLAMAECQAGEGKLAEARQRLEALEKTIPASPDVHQDLTDVYARLQLKSEAARERATYLKLQPTSAAGPQVNEMAPDFALPDVSGAKVALRDYRGKSPVVLVFGSYSCPNFRSSASALKILEAKYGKRAPFLLVYIREAHAGAQTWQSTRNQREGIDLAPATTLVEKQDHASMCSRQLHLAFPAIVDGMDGAVETAYAAWPSRAFVIGRDGRIIYSTKLTELDFHADEMESALKKAIASDVARGKS